jgi:hypothetical protein
LSLVPAQNLIWGGVGNQVKRKARTVVYSGSAARSIAGLAGDNPVPAR